VRGDDRVVTCKLPGEVVERLDDIVERIDRSKSWIIRQALTEWLADEQRRYELTLEALEQVDRGEVISQEEALLELTRRRP
jgi:predicted transcriptional regulator